MAVMEGRVHAADREIERDVALAWHIANLQRPKDLPQLDKYLAKLKPAKAQSQTADEVAGIFLCLKAKGKSVTIQERKRA